MAITDLIKNITGIFTEENAKSIITKVIQSQLKPNEAVVGVDRELLGGFKFDIVEHDSINLQSEVTDNYVDTNRPIQDHVVKRPIEITMRGKIGAYPHYIANDIGKSILYYEAMSLVNSYIPKMPGAELARKTREKLSSLTGNGIINRLINSGISWSYGIGQKLLWEAWQQLINNWGKTPNEIITQTVVNADKEVNAFSVLYEMWQQSIEMSVTTHWMTFNNMIITNLRPLKEESDITEFSVTFKQINKVSSIVTSSKKTKQPVTGQKSNIINNGKTKGIEEELPDVQIR